jgi:hypothetical protein
LIERLEPGRYEHLKNGAGELFFGSEIKITIQFFIIAENIVAVCISMNRPLLPGQ